MLDITANRQQQLILTGRRTIGVKRSSEPPASRKLAASRTFQHSSTLSLSAPKSRLAGAASPAGIISNAATSGSRLKLSAITRVPSAKSRLKQPVASLCSSPLSPTTSNGRSSTTSESHSSASHENHSPRQSAPNFKTSLVNKKTSTGQSAQSLSTIDNGATQRPRSSISSNSSSRSRLIAPTTPTTKSVLPRLVKKPPSSNNEISSSLSSRQGPLTPNAHTTKSARLSSLHKQPVATPKTSVAKVPTSHIATKITANSSSSKHAIKSNHATPYCVGTAVPRVLPCGRLISSNSSASNQRQQPPASNRGPENCLGGRLNNLVAVVHPQQQQQSDDELPPAGQTKQLHCKQQGQKCTPNTTATATAINPAVQQRRDVVRAESERSKGGIVNLNHKDVNGATEGRENKPTATTTRRNEDDGFLSSSVNDLGNHRENKEAPPRGKEEARPTVATTIRGDHEAENTSRESKQDGTAAKNDTTIAATSNTIKQRLMVITTSGQGRAKSSLEADNSNNTTRARNLPLTSDHAPAAIAAAVSNGSTLATAPSSSLLAQSSSSSSSSPPSGNKFDIANSLSFENTANAHGDGGQRQTPASDKFQTTGTIAKESSRNHDGSQRDRAAGCERQQQTNMCSHSHNSSPSSLVNGAGGMLVPLDELAVASNVGDCYKSHRDQQPGGINLQQQRSRPSVLKSTSDVSQLSCAAGGNPASHSSYMKSENKNDHATKLLPPTAQSSSSSPLKKTCSTGAHKHAIVDHDNCRHHGSINDRLLRKPMGQQVLSLMMLDAGLLPATSQQQIPQSEESKSHVCLQSEPINHSQGRLEFLPSSVPSHDGRSNGNAHDGNNNDAYLASNNNEATFVFKSKESSLTFTTTNGFDSCASVRADLTSNRPSGHDHKSKQIHSTAAWAANHDFSRIETTGNGTTSISLPCSPRLERASRLARSRCHRAIGDSQQRLECALQDKLYHLDIASHPFNGNSGGYQRATARWLSPVTAGGSQSPRRYGSPARSSPGTSAMLKSPNLHCDTANQATLEAHSSLASSSCSSLTNNHCPPVLALSNQLDAREFHEMIRANVDESVRRMKQEQQAQQQNGHGVHTLPNESRANPCQLGGVFSNEAATPKLMSDTQVDQSPGKQWGPQTDREQQTNLSSKIDRLNESAARAAGSVEAVAEKQQQQQHGLASALIRESEREKSRSNNIIDVETNKEIQPGGGNLLARANDTQHFEFESRRQQQPRSNSIGGQDFHHFNGAEHQHSHQHLKQSLLGQSHLQQNPYIDPSQYYNRRQLGFNGNLTPSQQYQTALTSADPRSISPSYSLAGGASRPTDIYVPKRSASIKYPLDRQHRNNLHASLECLNTTYSEYGQSPNQKQQHLSAAYHLARQQQYAAHQQTLQYQSFQPQQKQPTQNTQYATSYVMTAAPAETIVNQNGGQDLAAADMGAPPMQLQQQQQHHHYPVISSASNGTSVQQQSQPHNTSYQIQNLFNSRPSLQMSQSPLHRRLGVGAQASQMAGQNGSSNPMRAGHSSLSLASSAYLIEDKLQSEIKQLSSELKSEKEKNEALNNQLTINSSLMAAFEQSLTTLNNRLRQMTTINERKDQEIDELRGQLSERNCLDVDRLNSTSEKSTSPICGLSVIKLTHEKENDTLLQLDNNDDEHHTSRRHSPIINSSPVDGDQDQKSENNLMKVIEDLKRQLVVKERLLTETRLEALSAASKLEELESKFNGEHSLLVNEDDLDEGLMVANHSPSDSDAITDSAHFSEMNSHVSKSSNSNNYHAQHQHQTNGNNKPHSQRNSNNLEDMILFTPTHSIHSNQNTNNNDNHPRITNTSSRLSNNSTDDTNEMIHLHRQIQMQQHDNQSNHSSSDYHVEEDKSPGDTSTVNQEQQKQDSIDRNQQREASRGDSRESDTINKLLSGLLLDN